ncbi:DUF6297 family protein [Pengzhenrongella sicca]|uniref:Uncharacterized protein n=1 Tax=Pengzhenrongella sicca TaxID=2819238 RepID=A0A8A4ZCQ0_9MICO|nr:DUF6297 family protein [Pengzhenrongella sicca]QTE28653.1 hypothetical protein J4E96_15020 [Pengzhenrongella sicca]
MTAQDADAGAAPLALAVPSGRQIRRLTSATARRRGGAGIGELLGDVYYAVISAAIGIALALGLVNAMRDALPPEPAVPLAGPDLSIPSLATLFVVGLVGVLLSLAGRLGPVGVGGAEATWWLSLPVDRRGLLRPTAVRLPLLAGAVATVLLALIDLGLPNDGSLSVGRALRVGAVGGLGAALLVLLAGVGQSLGAVRRRIAATGNALIALVPLLALLGAVLGWSLSDVPEPPAVLIPVLAVAVVAAAVALDRRLARIPARDLRDSGSVASQAVGAVVSLDSRELGRALTDGAAATRRRRVARFGWVRSAETALVAADLAVFVRSPRHVLQVVAAACVPAVFVGVHQIANPGVLAAAVVVSGYVAMVATAEGARRAEMAPILDRLLPLEAARVRQLRMVVPGAVMLAWSAAAFAAVAQLQGGLGGWLVLAVLSTPVWAGAAVRSAYRPSPDWSGPLVSTAAGALPVGIGGVLARGPDVVILGLVPVLISIVLGFVTTPVLLGQVAASAIALAVCAHVKAPPTASE